MKRLRVLRRIFILLLPVFLILAAGARWGRGATKININTADPGELQRLPGIGPVLAQRIVDDRGKNGSFKKIEELKRVFGIGSRKYELIKDLIDVEGESGPGEGHRQGGKLNLNTATQLELEDLPGIGPVKARRIIQFRETHHGFSRVEDLEQVYGIGPKTIANLRALVSLRDGVSGSRSSSRSPSGPLRLKCWKCGKTFKVPGGERRGTCPYCGARWELK